MAASAKFWDRIANFYSKQPVSDETAYQKKLKVTRAYFDPHMKVLEFGCGTGSTALTHAPHVKHIRAIDISRKMLAIAKDKADKNNVKNVTFEQTSIDDLPPPDQPLDAVMGHSILHLLEDKDAALGKVHTMLKPGGLFVSSTSCLGNKKLLKKLLPLGSSLGLLPKVNFFSEQELENSLTKAGFHIDFSWQPGHGKALFIVAKKAD